jgi:hypothetical protein
MERVAILKLKYIIHVYIPTSYYFFLKNVGYAREYPGTMLGPPMPHTDPGARACEQGSSRHQRSADCGLLHRG